MWNPLGVTNHTLSWRPEPTTRGTWSLISSCIATIGLCVWTAVHLNVPEHGRTGKHVWRKVKWVIISLIAPEIVCFVAFEQWREQILLHRFMLRRLAGSWPPPNKKPKRCYCFGAPKTTNGPCGVPRTNSVSVDSAEEQNAPASQTTHEPGYEETEKDPTYSRKFPWTVSHSFYAIMGGFVFDNLSTKAEFPLPQGLTRLTLSPEALIFLAEFEPHLVPDISEEAIKDKSKSGGISKVIAFWQALWFTAQFIMRLAQGLNVSMLELNTILHVVCAVVAYFGFWWNKPLDIMEPTLIALESQDTAIICAAMAAVSEVGKPDFRLPIRVVERVRATLHLPTHPRLSARALALAVLFVSPGFPHDEIHLQSHLESALEGSPPVPAKKAVALGEQVRTMMRLSPPDLEPSELPQNILVRYPRNWEPLSKPTVIRSLIGPDFGASDLYELTCSILGDTREHEEANITLGSEDVRRYYLAAHGLSKYPTLMVLRTADFVSRRAKSVNRAKWTESLGLGHRRRRVSTPSGDSSSDGERSTTQEEWLEAKSAWQSPLVSIAGFCIASVVYGGVHLLLGWNGPMNTQTEILLWRVSGSFALALPVSGVIVNLVCFALGLVLLAVGVLPLLYLGLVSLLGIDQLRRPITRWVKFMRMPIRIVIYQVLLNLLTQCFIMFFLLSRAYIVFECFYSVLFVPPSVYHMPVWAAYFFHF